MYKKIMQSDTKFSLSHKNNIKTIQMQFIQDLDLDLFIYKISIDYNKPKIHKDIKKCKYIA